MHIFEALLSHLPFNWLCPQTCSIQQLCINLLRQHTEQSVNTFNLLKQLISGHRDVVRVPQLKLHPGKTKIMAKRALCVFIISINIKIIFILKRIGRKSSKVDLQCAGSGNLFNLLRGYSLRSSNLIRLTEGQRIEVLFTQSK